MSRINIFVSIILFLGISFCFAEESITITTYYPSPYGVYKELRLYPNDSPNACNANNEGAMYYDDTANQTKVCRQTGSSPATYAWRLLGGECPDVPGANQSNCWLDVVAMGIARAQGIAMRPAETVILAHKHLLPPLMVWTKTVMG